MKTLLINESIRQSRINPEIYGHFAEHLGRCIYDGLYVGEDSAIPNVNGIRTDIVEALKAMKIPVLRWPGGCFADEYHWRDGIGPKESRKHMINTTWGGAVEDNSFGTHEFFELCEQLGCKTYINGNLGSGTVQEMQEWVEYMTSSAPSPVVAERKKNGRDKPWKVDYFGIGNESWGCGGHMPPRHYAGEYRRYNTFVKNYDWDHPIKRIASGPNGDDYNWTDQVLDTIFNDKGHAEEYEAYVQMLQTGLSGLALHYYTYPEGPHVRGRATGFDEEVWYKTLARAAHIDELIGKHGDIMDKYDPQKKVGMMIDEWGTWYQAEEGDNPFFLYQQNTMRDALVAGLSLNIFNKRADRVHMANIAQLVNVLQAVILTEGERMILTPTYQVFKMYAAHQGATLLQSAVEGNEQIGCGEFSVAAISESVSMAADGTINATVNNLSATDSQELIIAFDQFKPGDVKATILTNEINAHNTFDKPNAVDTEAFTDVEISDAGIRLRLPACSVIHLAVT